MDTDELSKETYEAVIGTASKLHEDLRLQFGLIAMQCLPGCEAGRVKMKGEYLTRSSSYLINLKLISILTSPSTL